MKAVATFSLLLTLFVPAMADGLIDAEREELFWASRQLAAERDALPSRQIGLFVTMYDRDGNPVNVGAKYELAMAKQFWVSVEAIHLKNDGIGAMVSLKAYLSDRQRNPLYIGAGLALRQPVDYQVFAGYEIFNNFYGEVKFMGAGGDLSLDNPYLTAGFNLPF